MRMWIYELEEVVIEDVFCLLCGMIYKNVVVGLNLGGGKMVIIGDFCKDKNEVMFCVFGCFI